ncbi:hypothetical protein ASPSYDRAFT_26720 [Aspergillus sydowii CBS 593.65]|uniref:Zn(2)-C6 fungal-type domain-containing protein n=1 Tax=Aspergillus sydowii CBS 593.65 TaxID=1036612 RepID=A0A1L9TZ88_9EURO|nr:uncharacterized protein ASPSYDRAFT_26720 [Aspergillus sydowii CBS 593.65]OJJ64741.1 hypothetical protein ASPSYDRAFT_26720 [Aspergillus sydowii CBS 593.65]
MRNPADKACHNCRRRRLKCDRDVPACRKCALTGQDCLGYGKLFVWNEGVASRGKMMGKTYPVPARDTDSVNTRSLIPAQVHYSEVFLPLQQPLLDPLYQGLDDTSRGYLSHFASTVSSDMVIANISDVNPFRSLIPFCRDHPILLHIILANSALHISCLHRRRLDGPEEHMPGLATGELSTTDAADRASRAMVDALSAKHKALILLRHALEDMSHIDVDMVAAVVHLFIIFELISPGEDEWKAHVEGALRLISYLHTLEIRHASPAALVRDCVTSDCLTYYILGSSLMNTTTLSDPFLLPGDIIASLTRAEVTSYLSLPTPLLQTLFKACELSNRVSLGEMLGADPTPLLNQANDLLNTVQSFDVYAWAATLEGGDPFSARTLSRIHTALAHQNAVRIYILRSVEQISPSPVAGLCETESLVTEIVTHLSLVGLTDPIFKATSWPTFIAGAETDDVVYREWAVTRLREFWNLIPWGYLRTEEEVMRKAWRLRDGQGERKMSWIQQLKGMERHWLIA